jgi:hypothetical protein
MQTLLDVQDEFADALLSAATPVPSGLKGASVRRADRRFAVYRNNVAVSLIDALGARFPVVKRLVGDEFFSAMAHEFVLREPPLSPLLIHYGETFPAFIEAFDAAEPLPYLADVARLEYARGRAYHSADVEPLPRAAFAALPAGGIGAARVTLHPSVGIIASRFPVLSIWEVNQDQAVRAVPHWGDEAVVVARPFLEVETQLLLPGSDVFLLALQKGATIGEAAERAAATTSEFNASDGLAVLIGAHLAVDLHEVC